MPSKSVVSSPTDTLFQPLSVKRSTCTLLTVTPSGTMNERVLLPAESHSGFISSVKDEPLTDALLL